MILSKDVLAHVCVELRQSGKSIVFTNGCFDIIHAGHVTYLAQAKRLGDILIIGMNSDSSVKILKGEGRPVNNENDRAAVLDSLRSVDFVTIFSDETPAELIAELKPNILVKGGDYTPEQIAGADFVTKSGGEVIIIPFLDGKSTTNIIRKISGLK